MITQTVPLVLASGSVIRQQMLKAVGLDFSVEPSGVDEEAVAEAAGPLPPAKRALAIARAKALAVAARYPDAITIGADQICRLDGAILNKPGSYDNACAQLALLSGKTHSQHCGLVMAQGTGLLWEYEAEARLTMHTLSTKAIRAYVQEDAPLSSCGSYKFESMGKHLFAEVSGDPDVIQGMPLVPLLAQLHARGAISLG